VASFNEELILYAEEKLADFERKDVFTLRVTMKSWDKGLAQALASNDVVPLFDCREFGQLVYR